MSQSDDRWGERAERTYDEFTAHPWRKAFKWIAIFAVALILIGGATGVAGWIGGWWNKAAEVTGAQNTDNQFTALYGDMESMRATAGNACAAKESTGGANSPTFLEDPSFSYTAKYRSIEADYNRRFENFFEAGGLIVKPNDLPRRAPTLGAMQAQVC